MPTAAQILQSLAQLAREWWPLAAAWHAYLVAFALALAWRWRPSLRVAALASAAPLASVVALAWWSGNPFTTLVLGATLAGALVIGVRRPTTAVSFAPMPHRVAGALMLLFALLYPHFLDTPAWTYLYAAPVGIVPCPTLSALVGLGLVLRTFESRAWALLVGGAGLFYGVFGALHLGVTLDWILALGALLLMIGSRKA